ncbi:MAG: hypothetical protein ABJB98_09710 [Actinomycetota bacterium]
MTRLRSGPLAAWASAWLSGLAASDEVLRATMEGDRAHRVQGLPGTGDSAVPLSEVLIEWRRRSARTRLVLPVPGDLRGVPGPGGFRAAAVDAGEAVFGSGLGLVPDLFDHPASSAPPSVTWHAYEVADPPPDPLDVAQARLELTETIRACATALAAADVARWTDAMGEALTDARRAGERPNLPPGFPPVAVHLVAQAERLHAILDVAALDPVGGAVTRAGMATRANTLRPLATAVRRARLAGYNAGPY